MRRISELDALRGIAALLIVVYHFRPQHFYFGWAAVDLFFVLSGYLITSIVLANRDAEGFLKTFYARRCLRLWPIYYFTLIAIVMVNPFLTAPYKLDALPYYAFYLQNIPWYWSGDAPSFNPHLQHTWTLALEEQFYLIWPGVVMLLGRRSLKSVCVITILMSIAARAYGFDWWLLLARCDGFAFGGLLALHNAPSEDHEVPAKRGTSYLFLAIALSSLYLAIGVVALGGAHFLHTPFGPPYRSLTVAAFNLLFTGMIGLIVRHSGEPVLKLLRMKPLIALGKLSYGLYLYHILVFWALDACLPRDASGGRAWYIDMMKIPVSLGLAAASWRYIERPILNLKDRFEYRPTSRTSGRLATVTESGRSAAMAFGRSWRRGSVLSVARMGPSCERKQALEEGSQTAMPCQSS